MGGFEAQVSKATASSAPGFNGGSRLEQKSFGAAEAAERRGFADRALKVHYPAAMTMRREGEGL